MFWAAHRSSSGVLTVFATSGLHTHVMTGRSQVWVGLRPVITCVCKPEAANTVRAPDDERCAARKKVEPLMNGGIINFISRLHLVGYFSWVILRCTDPWILNFSKPFEKFHVSLKPDKNNGFFMTPYVNIRNISLKSAQNDKCCRQKL
jgi:hypothetical protein